MPSNVVYLSGLPKEDPVGRGARLRKRKCAHEDNCIHRHAPAEILLNPEILQSIQLQYGAGSSTRGGLPPSSNPLLEFCLDGGGLSCCGKIPRKSLFLRDKENPPGGGGPHIPPLLQLVSSSNLSALIHEKLKITCQTESCDINVQNHRGESALHLLLKGCSQSSFQSVLKCTKVLLDFGIDVNLSDSLGNKPLHVLRDLLSRNLFSEAARLALCLLGAGADINATNNRGRSLLSFAVAFPSAEAFVRLLLEQGALVWVQKAPEGPPRVEGLLREREESAFTWFVRSIIAERDLNSEHLKILHLLCHSMSDEELDPQRLRRRVLSTLVYLSVSARVMGPVFLQLKRAISPFWTQPLPLKYLCKRKIRKSLSGGPLPGGLPKGLRDYLELERAEF